MTKLTNKKLLVAIIISAMLVGSSIIWFTRQVAEAAVLNPHPGLVGWWRFDEIVDVDKIKDSSGNGNDGTVYGATLVDGKYGKALGFDGTSNYVEVSANPSLFPSNAITIEFWAKIASADINSNAYMGFVCRNTYLNGLQVIKQWGDGRVIFETPNTAYLLSTLALTPDVWNHVVCMLVSGSSATIYINGQQQGSSTGWTLPTESMNYWVGRAAEVTTNPFLKGGMDEVRIYNRALSAAEVQESFQRGPNFSSRPLAKAPKGTTQLIATVSWQGIGSINVTIQSPSEDYTEDVVPVYQKIMYSTSDGASGMLNIKRLSVTVTPLASNEDWYVLLEFDNIEDYRITVEVQK